MNEYDSDVLIIGAGVVGKNIARELLKHNIAFKIFDPNQDKEFIDYYVSEKDSSKYRYGIICVPTDTKLEESI